MKRRKPRLIIMLLISCLMVNGCGTRLEEDGAGSHDSDAETSAAYAAYLDTLEEYSDAIRSYWWQYDTDDSSNYGDYESGDIAEDPDNKCVAFCDLNGDDIPELLFMAYDGEMTAFLHVFTYKDGKAVEYDYVDPYKKNYLDELLADYHAAAGVRYMVYTGTEDGSLYIATREGDAYSAYTIAKYNLTSDSIDNESTVSNRYEVYSDGQGDMVTEDEYMIDGQTVSAGEGVEEFKTLSSDYSKLIMCAGYVKDMQIFEHVKNDTALAMKYSEAVEYARSQAGDTETQDTVSESETDGILDFEDFTIVAPGYKYTGSENADGAEALMYNKGDSYMDVTWENGELSKDDYSNIDNAIIEDAVYNGVSGFEVIVPDIHRFFIFNHKGKGWQILCSSESDYYEIVETIKLK